MTTIARPLVFGLLTLGLAFGAGARPQGQSQQDLARILESVRGQVRFPAEAARAKSALEQRSDKIDPALLQLGDEVRSKGFGEFTSKAADLGVTVTGSRVLVTLFADDENDVPDLRREAERRGAVVQSVLENAIFVEMPPASIEPMASVDELYFAARQGRVEAKRVQGANLVKSEGILASKVEHLHASGIVGRGVKIGILDFGFQGLASLISRGEVQAPKATRAFGGPTVENGEAHGAACAEIIHDMAPGAELYIASVGNGDGGAGDGQLVAAAQWLASQQVHIISFSGGGHHGPHNGRSILDRMVDTIVKEQNILWVNAAGNEGDEHVGGSATDRDGDGVVEFGPNGLNGVAFQATAGSIKVLVNWDDWGDDPSLPASTQDIDAFLFAVDANGGLQPVAHSVNPQRGRGAPLEFIGLRVADPEQVFVLKLRATRLTRPVKIHILNYSGAKMEPRISAGSISQPATSSSSLAVGAVDVQKSLLETFSSQGPTDDGRLKPEVSASDKNVTISYRTPRDPDGRFPGTSAACPHVSGFAALLKQLKPALRAPELKQLVIANVRDMGVSGPDSGYGHGHIDGGGLKPQSEPDPDAGAGSVESVPDAFGRLTQADFGRLWDLARTRPNEGLRVVTGTGQYSVGDGLKVGIRSGQDCYYMLVHRDSSARFSVLAPSTGNGKLVAGERYALPEGETWRVQPPAGRDGLLLVCSGQRVDLAGWIRRPDDRTVWLATTTFDVTR